MITGTEGYQENQTRFIQSSQALDFHIVCKDFLDYLPSLNSHVLDVGSGAGQNAAALAKLGYKVTAVEPIAEFISASQHMYQQADVHWLMGSLPDLACLESDNQTFDFVLIEGVWHHLNEEERTQTAIRVSQVINKQGRCAISLRNGPAGLGACVYSTDADETIETFNTLGFECIFKIENQDSILPNKKNVKWSRIVLEKQT